MKKIILTVFVIFLSLALFVGCSPNDTGNSGGGSGGSGSDQNEQGGTMNDHEINISQTGWTTLVPNDYKTEASEQGTVARLDYASKDYVRGGGNITKTAYVYTPYGYDGDADTRYNILYLMHG